MPLDFILQENRKPSFTEQIMGPLESFVGAFREGSQRRQNLANSKNALERLGLDPSIAGLPPELQKVAISESLRASSKEKLLGQKLGSLQNIFGGGMGSGEMSKSSPAEQLQGKGKGFSPANISDEDILQLTAIDPQLGGAARALKDTAMREQRAQQEYELKSEKFAEEKRRASPEFKREQALTGAQAQADVKYNQALQEQERQGKLKSQSLENLERLNNKGVTGKPFEKLLEKGGLTALTSEGRREFAADVKNLITDIRSILGGQFSQFEFQTILNAYPSADFSKEANAAIIKNLKIFQDIKNKEVQFARDIKKENDGKIPDDFQNRVNERVNAYTQSRLADIKQNTQKIMNDEYGIKPGFVLMFDPFGEPMSVPENEVTILLEQGASLP